MGETKEQHETRIGEPQPELLKRFHEEHAQLHDMLRSLRERIRDVAAGSGEGARARSEAESLLGELEERLPRHFATEERAGFLSEAVNQAPRLSRRADELRAECRRFTEAYHDHESRENALIHEAWTEDIGAVD